MGEAPKLDADEALGLVKAYVARAAPLPIVVGVSAPGFARHARDGAHGGDGTRRGGRHDREAAGTPPRLWRAVTRYGPSRSTTVSNVAFDEYRVRASGAPSPAEWAYTSPFRVSSARSERRGPADRCAGGSPGWGSGVGPAGCPTI
jgi:hypothetical protein